MSTGILCGWAGCPKNATNTSISEWTCLLPRPDSRLFVTSFSAPSHFPVWGRLHQPLALDSFVHLSVGQARPSVSRSSSWHVSAIISLLSHSRTFWVAIFLVACYATQHPALSVRRLVGWSVGRSVGRSVPFLLFRRFLGFWAHSSFPNASKSHSKSF